MATLHAVYVDKEGKHQSALVTRMTEEAMDELGYAGCQVMAIGWCDTNGAEYFSFIQGGRVDEEGTA